MRVQSLPTVVRRIAAVALMALTAHAAHAGDVDPEPGQSWLQSLRVTDLREHLLTRAVLLATDDFGVTRQRELRIEARGSVERRDREVTVHRYEPECLPLAKAAGMSADDFCDRLVLTRNERGLELAFHSVDANKRYGFTLVPASAGRWESQRVAGIAAPSLTLQLDERDGNARYAWSLESLTGRYTQVGVLAAADLRDLQLDAIEASLGALTDVLRSFHANEFAYADLPRDHALYRPTPYGLWSEGPLDTHCTFIFCFGSVGGSGGGGSQGMCNPNSPNYAPQYCPWDLTTATWPVSHRMHVKKMGAGSINLRYAIKNDGTGTFDGSPFNGSSTPIAHLTLVRMNEVSPLVPAGSAPYGDECFAQKVLAQFETIDPFTQFTTMVLEPGDVAMDIAYITCNRSSGRPGGRYHPYAHIDHTDTLDSAGMSGNNSEVNRLDWVKLAD